MIDKKSVTYLQFEKLWEITLTATMKEGKHIGYCGRTTELTDVTPAQAMPETTLLTKFISIVAITRLPFLLASILLFLVISWFNPEALSIDREVSVFLLYGHFKIDAFSQVFKIIFVTVALAVSLISSSYFKEDEPHQAEYYTLLLSSTLGMLIVASANDFLTLFLGIEISAFSSYALVAFRKQMTSRQKLVQNTC